MDSSILEAFLMMVVFAIGSSAPVPDEPLEEKNLVVEVPRPYDFGFEFGDGEGMFQYRQESSDINGQVQGSYGYTDPNGVRRNVEYTAGVDGYKAVIRSNEPGLSNQNPADVTFIVDPPPPEVIAQQVLSGSSSETAVPEI